MLTLYHFNNSVCSEKVRMVLFEKGIEWESREVDLFKSEQFDPEYLKLNPKGVVPTLVDEGHTLTESTLIAEYLDDKHPEPALKPADPAARAEMRLYSKACDEGLHQGVAVLSYSAMFMDRLRAMPREALEAHLGRIPDLERRDRQVGVYEHGVEAPHVERGVVAYEKVFQKIDKALTDGRDWLVGDMFSLAEINLAVYFARLEYMTLLDVWTGERPAAAAWFERVKARPCFQKEVVDWVREDEWAEMAAGGARIKDAVAAKRRHYLDTDPAANIA
ncbi:MAG TPA: glutathione S-transferase family protein [Alphaproteobacteria bacterium]|nr:glutathione S-transferase family protein [Alphaproteobacteria bacterium]